MDKICCHLFEKKYLFLGLLTALKMSLLCYCSVGEWVGEDSMLIESESVYINYSNSDQHHMVFFNRVRVVVTEHDQDNSYQARVVSVLGL